MASADTGGKAKAQAARAGVPWARVLTAQLVGYVRMPLLAATALWLIGTGPYMALADVWRARGWSERAVFVAGTWLVHECLYVPMNCFFMLCDSRGWLAEYKLPRTPAQQPKPELIRRTLQAAFVGHVFIQPLSLYLVWPLFQANGSAVFADLPSWWTVFWHLTAAGVFLDVAFYATHRALHESKWLYRNVHHQHHAYVGTIGFAAEYSHWFEDAFSAQIPTAVVPLVCGSHVVVWWVWLGWRLFETYESHSGYYFPYLHGDVAAYHDEHHAHALKGNYAGSPFLDYVFGTNAFWHKRTAAGQTGVERLRASWAQARGAAQKPTLELAFYGH